MKRILAVIFALAILSTTLGVTAFAAKKTVQYYDEKGNPITISGLYYSNQGVPMYNAGCYYLDENGEPVYVGGCRAYYYDADGNLVAGNYYYDQNGNAVTRPSSYPNGYGCGAYYYNTQGKVVNTTTYYDDFGNAVEAPATPQQPIIRGGWGGGCCWR